MTLLVADYGQLELRLLAHISKCKSMIDAFTMGGDFHSRTAMGMYPEIREAMKRGEALLEWDAKNDGPPPAPLLKDAFAAQRRNAKTLNFSIACVVISFARTCGWPSRPSPNRLSPPFLCPVLLLFGWRPAPRYGKTAHGLSKDWDVSVEEARETLEKWYEDRPEVREWQTKTIEYARETGYTRTLMGRYRRLPDINTGSSAARAHMERAAINTPIQGGAADVVMMAMLKVHRNERLRKIGWRMLLQIHDELILEGPDENSEEAMALVTTDMMSPFRTPLLVELDVDAKLETTWYRAK